MIQKHRQRKYIASLFGIQGIDEDSKKRAKRKYIVNKV